MGTLYSVNCKEQFTEYIVHTATVTRSLFHLRASCEVTQIFGSVIMKFYLCKFICWIRVSSFIIKSVPSAGFKFPHHMLNTGPGVASKLSLQCHKSYWYSTCQPRVSDGARDDRAQWSSNWRKKKRSCFGLKVDMKCCFQTFIFVLSNTLLEAQTPSEGLWRSLLIRTILLPVCPENNTLLIILKTP